jgi:hypothetical protein
VTQGLLLFAVALAMFWSYRRWWLAVRWLLVLIVVEGAIRKWVLPGQQQLVYLIKDFLALAIYAGYLGASERVRRVRVPVAVVVPLIGCALWAGFQIFNPKLPSLLVGIFGWKAYFWYAPMLWVVPAAFRDLVDFDRFLRRYVLLVIPVVALGLLQFRAPATSELNRYARGQDVAGSSSIAVFGESGAARVTGPFSYITGYSTFLVFGGISLLIVLGVRGLRLHGSIAQWLALLSIPAGLLVSGSRGPVILLGILLPLLFLFGQRDLTARVRALMRLLTAAAFGAALLGSVTLPALEAFSYRVRSTEEDFGARLAEPLTGPLRLATEVGFGGYGAGSTHQATAALVPDLRPLSWLDGLEAEVEPSRVMIELGPIGFVLHYSYRIALIVMAFGIATAAKRPAARVVAMGAAFFLLAQLPGAIVFDVYCGIYFWFLAGAALLARSWDLAAPPLATAASEDVAARASIGWKAGRVGA